DALPISFDVEGDRQQRFDGIDLEATGGHLGGRGEGAGFGPVRLALGPAGLVGVDQGDDLDVGVVEVGPHVQVVDAAETDEGGPDRTVIRREAHGALFLVLGRRPMDYVTWPTNKANPRQRQRQSTWVRPAARIQDSCVSMSTNLSSGSSAVLPMAARNSAWSSGVADVTTSRLA